MRERERTLLKLALSHTFWITSWTDEYPGTNSTAWGTNHTARTLATLYEDSYFHVESICYDGHAEQAFLDGTLTDEVNVKGYEPFTVSEPVVVVPVVPPNASERPIARIAGVDDYDCDATLGRSG